MEPIWVDLQINGYGGVDFNAPNLTVDAVKSVVRKLASDGTKAFLPTFVTGDPEMVLDNIRTIVEARKQDIECERSIIGLHLEGPFISSQPGAVGTHPIEWVVEPSLEKFNRYQDASNGLVKLVTVAAEVPGMPEFVKALSSSGVAVSLGHQMASSPNDVEPCISAGAKAFTHLGNGIPNMINRHNNVIFTALAEDRTSVMFIPDGHHLPDTILKVFSRAVDLKRLIAVSDAQYPAGMPAGRYKVCGANAVLEPDGLLWNPERNCLVGATAPMSKMMTLLQERIGFTYEECLAVGRDNPLRLINL
jgi:N-acetylglucosamine-6-phosphate deacetylase